MAVLARTLFVFLIIALAAAEYPPPPNDHKLEFVILVTRHGARSPTVGLTPNVTISSDLWKIELGKQELLQAKIGYFAIDLPVQLTQNSGFKQKYSFIANLILNH